MSAGARMASLEAVIERAKSILQADQRIAAAWLEGSFAEGRADAWSDIDLNVAVRDDEFEAMLAERHELLAKLAPVLGYAEVHMRDGFLVAATLQGLDRVDLLLFREGDVGLRVRPHIRTLLDRSSVTERFQRESGQLDLAPLVRGQLSGFFYGAFQPLRLWNRDEHGSLQMGWYLVLFQHVVPLWLAVDDPANAFRPHLHNERFLSRTRRERLEAFLAGVHAVFGSPHPDVEGFRALQAAIFEMAFSALRAACERWDVRYPIDAERAVRATYREELALPL